MIGTLAGKMMMMMIIAETIEEDRETVLGLQRRI